MSYRNANATGLLSTLVVSIILVVIQPACQTYAASIVLGEIEYTRDGRAEDDSRNAIETYLEFFLPRLQHRKPQRLLEYIRNCQPKEPDGSCPLPDFYIQLQIAERQGEAQISGAVAQKTEPKNLQPYNLDSIRVKIRDLTDGLSRVAKNIDAIITNAAPPINRTRVIIGCFGPNSGMVGPSRRRPRLQARTPMPTTPATADAASIYADRLPLALETLMRDETRIAVSASKETGTNCGSIASLRAMAQTANAEAVLSGRVFSDDKSGLMVLPQIFIVSVAKKIALPLISLPSGVDAIASYELVARPLSAISYALLRSDKRGDFIKAIGDGRELSYYLDQATEHLSLSPPEYDAADALLELARSKAPTDQQSYLLMASSLAARMRYTEAAATLQAGIDRASDSKALYIALADNFIRSGELSEARAVYERALKENILSDDALVGIAMTYLSERSSRKAMEYALQAAAHNPTSTEAYVLAGQIAEVDNDFETAEKYYKTARTLSPNSTQVVSRLSNLYERWKNIDLRKADLKSAIDHLTTSIEVLPSVRKYYDRASLYLEFYGKSDDRLKGYKLASVDFTAALQIAREKNSVLTQFPWLMPNLAETLIFEGKYTEAKQVATELFAVLASGSSIRSSIDPKDIRLITAFLNAAAQILDVGSAEKELYLFENAALGMNFGRLSWSFSEMLSYLDQDYPRIAPQLHPDDRDERAAAVKQWIRRLMK